MSATKHGSITPAQRRAVLKHARELCLAFPDVTESLSDSISLFCVGKEPFAALTERDAGLVLSLRVGAGEIPARAATLALEKDAERKGWVSLALKGHINWAEIQDLALVAFVGIAPKRALQALEKRLPTN